MANCWTPHFSIVIPTYGRPIQLAGCLESLARLNYPRHQFEVIVVDDGSGTPPESAVAFFRDRLDVKLLVQGHAGPAKARNMGAAQARGDFLAFTDDDCVVPINWLKNLTARCLQTPDHAIGGRTINGRPKNLYSAASQAIIDVAYLHYNTNHKKGSFFASNNLTIPADQFHAIGGFDVTFKTSEDRDICDRWRHHGFRMTYAPEVLVYHSNDLNFRTFWRQHFNYGRGAYRYHQARARRGTGRFRPDPTFYMRLLCYPFMQKQGKRASGLTILLVISQVANAMGFFWETLNRIRRR